MVHESLGSDLTVSVSARSSVRARGSWTVTLRWPTLYDAPREPIRFRVARDVAGTTADAAESRSSRRKWRRLLNAVAVTHCTQEIRQAIFGDHMSRVDGHWGVPDHGPMGDDRVPGSEARARGDFHCDVPGCPHESLDTSTPDPCREHPFAPLVPGRAPTARA